ncbi:hypothetical protein TNCV_2747301 [Trichonephila clavipes]|nr:hypothetical protein TNCV_2747301 [Trichonephila clavipes]
MSPDLQWQIEAHEIHHDKGLDCTPVVSRSFEHHASYKDLRLDGYLQYPHAANALSFTNMNASPGFKPKSYGPEVSLANHYTEWVVALKENLFDAYLHVC